MAYKDYEESSAVKAAQQAARDNYSKKPGEYQESQWAGALRDTMGQLQNRKPFSYDVNGDALYQQYKDKYTQQGKLAMQDTVGQVSALTGGYANSYAATAGQQAYQASLSNLNDVVPQLYSLAYDKYNQDLSNLQNMASMYNALEEQNRSNYQNAVTNWTNEQNRLDSLAMNMATQDLNKYNTNASNYYNEQAQLLEREKLDAAASPSLKKPTSSMYDKALKAYSEGGEEGLDKYINTLPGYDTDLIFEHISLYGRLPLEQRTYTKTKDTVNGLWGVDRNDVVEDQYGNKYKIKDLPKDIRMDLTGLEKDETWSKEQSEKEDK